MACITEAAFVCAGPHYSDFTVAYESHTLGKRKRGHVFCNYPHYGCP